MNKLLHVYKPVGMTPLQIILKVREEFSEFKDQKIGYAGRLDPMAHGVLLLMIGDATKERNKYLGLDKEYVFEVLFGVMTDTYDILGLVTDNHLPIREHSITDEMLKMYVATHSKTVSQIYPPYSSKAVKGKPLFWWSRENRLSEVTLPFRTIAIYTFDFLSMQLVLKTDLEKLIYERLALVKGDFRQEKIYERWTQILVDTKLDTYTTAKFHIRCSSGTYVRSLIHSMGKSFGTGAIALDILRTKIGEYSINNSIKLKTT